MTPPVQQSPNPAQPQGATETPENVATETELGGLFQPNEHQPAGSPEAPETPETPAGAPETPGTPETPAAPASTLSREDIVSILKEAGIGGEDRPSTAPSTVAPEPTMTPEQFEKAFNVFNPSEDLVKRLTDESPAVRIKAITELRDGLVRQAMTMAEYRIQQHVGALRTAAIEPLQTYVSERQATEFHDEFFKAHPDLEPYELIVDAVASKLQEKGFTAPSRKEVMKRFAEDSRAAVQALLAKGQPGAGAPGHSPTAGNGAPIASTKPRRTMSTLSGGGQGGGSKPSANGGGADYSNLPKTVAAGLAALD